MPTNNREPLPHNSSITVPWADRGQTQPLRELLWLIEERHGHDEIRTAGKGENCSRRQCSSKHVATKPFSKSGNRGTGPVLSIDPWTVKHTQLLSVVHRLYFTQSDVFNNFKSLLGNVLLCTDPASPLLRSTVESLCFISLGASKSDNRLLTKGRMRYGQALKLIARELQGQLPKHRPQRIRQNLVCIQLMSLCESFGMLSWPNEARPLAWVHLKGAQQYANMAGPAAIQNDYDWEIGDSIRMSSWWDALARRKANMYAEHEWLEVSMLWAPHDSFARLWDTALMVPGLLERLDKLLAAEQSTPEQRLSLVHSTLQVKADLHVLTDQIFLGTEDPRLAHVSTMTLFSSACANTTFLVVYEYVSCRAAQLHLLALTAKLYVNYTCLKLLSHTGMNTVGNQNFEDIELDSIAAASDICRAVPYCMQVATLQTKLDLLALLAIPTVVFEEAGAEAELQWCQDAYRAFYSPNIPRRLRWQPHIATVLAEGLRYRLPTDARTAVP